MDNVIKLDLREEIPDYVSQRTIQIKEGERGILLQFQILEFGQPFDLTGYEVRFKATLPDGWEVIDLVDVADAANGMVTYTTPLELGSSTGVFWPYLEVRSPENEFIDGTRAFRMQCINGTDVTVDANYIPEFYRVITDTQIAIASCNSATNAAIEATQAVTAATDAAFDALEQSEVALEQSTTAAERADTAAHEASFAANEASTAAASATAAANAANTAAQNATTASEQAVSACNAATTQAQQTTVLTQAAAENATAAANNALAIANSIAAGNAGDEEIAEMRNQIDQLGSLLANSTAQFVLTGSTVYAPSSKASCSGTTVTLPTSSFSGTTITLS